MKKKILYLFSDTGGGHRSAAKALMAGVKELKGETFEQEMIDVFAATSGFLNIFARLYGPVIKYYPEFWGRLYHWLNDWPRLLRLEKMARPFIRKELAGLLRQRLPDVVISVHPLVNHLTVQAMKDIGRIVPIITIVMDPVSVHKSWVCPEVNTLVVATEEAKKACLAERMPKARIKILGIPVDPKFLKKLKEKEYLREEMGLQPKLPTVLLMGGGEGAGRMYDIISALDSSELNLQLIIICGRNKLLEQKLIKMLPQFRLPMKIYGFTEEVPMIMDASDIIITKAGPGAIAESLAKNLPMIITSWLPGQEEGNIEYVVREKIGEVTREPRRVVELVERFLEPREFERIKRNIAKVRKPHAVYDIAKLILSYL